MGPPGRIAFAGMDLLERETAMALLDERLAAVRATGQGRLVLLAGEAGVGKTALLAAFHARHPSVRTVAGACEALFTPRPLGPLLDMAAELGGALASATGTAASPGGGAGRAGAGGPVRVDRGAGGSALG